MSTNMLAIRLSTYFSWSKLILTKHTKPWANTTLYLPVTKTGKGITRLNYNKTKVLTAVHMTFLIWFLWLICENKLSYFQIIKWTIKTLFYFSKDQTPWIKVISLLIAGVIVARMSPSNCSTQGSGNTVQERARRV